MPRELDEYGLPKESFWEKFLKYSRARVPSGRDRELENREYARSQLMEQRADELYPMQKALLQQRVQGGDLDLEQSRMAMDAVKQGSERALMAEALENSRGEIDPKVGNSLFDAYNRLGKVTNVGGTQRIIPQGEVQIGDNQFLEPGSEIVKLADKFYGRPPAKKPAPELVKLPAGGRLAEYDRESGQARVVVPESYKPVPKSDDEYSRPDKVGRERGLMGEALDDFVLYGNRKPTANEGDEAVNSLLNQYLGGGAKKPSGDAAGAASTRRAKAEAFIQAGEEQTAEGEQRAQAQPAATKGTPQLANDPRIRELKKKAAAGDKKAAEYLARLGINAGE